MVNFCRCPWRGQIPETSPCENICLPSDTPGVCDLCGFHKYDYQLELRDLYRDAAKDYSS